MAKVSLWGAGYTDVPALVVPDGEGGTSTFYENGGGTLITKTITENGTYSAQDDDADGYSEVTVNVSGGGASSWTKVGESTYQISTTSGSQTNYTTFETGYNNLFTGDKIVYIRIKDTAGKRSGYFFDSNNWYMPPAGATSYSAGVRNYRMYDGSRFIDNGNVGTIGYGVYTGDIYNNGNIVIRTRYSSYVSGTINGTYKVEVYLLDPAGGVSLFA